MTFKKVTPSFAGDSQHFGGDDMNKVSDYLGGTDISGTDIPDINTTTRYRSSKLSVRNPANTFSYIFAGSAITSADKTLTLPLLTGNDVAVTEAHTQSLTNKTANVDQNLIKDSTTNTQGDIYTYQTDRAKRLARGTANQAVVVNSGGTDTVFATLGKANIPTAVAYEDEANTFASNQKFDTFIEMKTITIPSDPASTYLRLYPKAVDANNDGLYCKTKINTAIVEVRVL